MDEGNNPKNVIKNVLYFSTEFIVIKQHANTAFGNKQKV